MPIDPATACAKCELRQRPCAGKCICKESGRDIREHIAAKECPKMFYRFGLPMKIKGTTPEIERARAKRGGCCGKPTTD